MGVLPSEHQRVLAEATAKRKSFWSSAELDPASRTTVGTALLHAFAELDLKVLVAGLGTR